MVDLFLPSLHIIYKTKTIFKYYLSIISGITFLLQTKQAATMMQSEIIPSL